MLPSTHARLCASQQPARITAASAGHVATATGSCPKLLLAAPHRLPSDISSMASSLSSELAAPSTGLSSAHSEGISMPAGDSRGDSSGESRSEPLPMDSWRGSSREGLPRWSRLPGVRLAGGACGGG